MNDADRNAFEEALLNRCKTIVTVPQDFDAGWQACCEWRDSQAGEPYLWMTEWWIEGGPDEGEYEYETNHINEFSCGRKKGFPLYRQPPAAQINQQLVEALDKLHAVVISKNRAGADWGEQFTDLMVALSLAQSALNAAKSGDV